MTDLKRLTTSRAPHARHAAAESTFEVDSALKSWLEKAGPDKIRNGARINQMGNPSMRCPT